MDSETACWIFEFLAINLPNISNTSLNNILKFVKPSNNLKLHKLILLRSIESDITENTLETLEVIEEIDKIEHGEAFTVSDSMKSAYCAVAVECTVKGLTEDGFRRAVERIWRGRVSALIESGTSGLDSKQLRVWKSRMEDSVVSPRVLKLDARNVLTAYLNEARALMRPSFLERVAEAGGLKETTGLIRKTNEQLKRKTVGFHRRAKGVRIAPDQESDIELRQSEYDVISTPEVNKLQEELRSSCLELQAVVKDPLPDALREADALVSNLAKKHTNTEHLSEMVNTSDASSPEPSAHGGIETAPASKANIQSEAERTALMGEASLQNETEVTAQTGEANIPIRKDGGKATASTPCGNDIADPVLTNENATGYQSHSHQTNILQNNLMERNRTAQTLEWDDSIDNSPLKLSNPKRLAVSPLKTYETTKVTKRRKKWSDLEELTLRNGVQQFGRGKWKTILDAYKDVFEERNAVDLKDKWRNLTK